MKKDLRKLYSKSGVSTKSKALGGPFKTIGTKTLGRLAGRAMPVVGAALGINELRKNVPKIVENVKAINKNYGYIRASKKKTKEMKEKLVHDKSKKQMIKKYKSKKKFNKSQDQGSILNKERKEYRGYKKKYNKTYDYLD